MWIFACVMFVVLLLACTMCSVFAIGLALMDSHYTGAEEERRDRALSSPLHEFAASVRR